MLSGLGFKARSVLVEKSDVPTIEQYEEEDCARNAKGITGDLVMLYPVENLGELQDTIDDAEERADSCMGRMVQRVKGVKTSEGLAKKEEKMRERLRMRAEMIVSLRDAGLTVVKSRSLDGKAIYVKVSASLERLEREAERQGIEMLVDPAVVKREKEEDVEKDLEVVALYKKSPLAKAVNWFVDIVFGADSKRVYRDFARSDRQDFDRSGQKVRTARGRAHRASRLVSARGRLAVVAMLVGRGGGVRWGGEVGSGSRRVRSGQL